MTETVPEHIITSDEERALCGAVCNDEDARVVPADRDPVADASLHLCLDCADEWARIKDDVEREPTVRCACDRADGESLWTCAEVVSVRVARALHHPAADGPAPVCPSCYEWLLNHPKTDVSTSVEDAPTWANLRCPRDMNQDA